MTDGTTFIGKFLEKDSRHLYFEEGTVPRGEVRSLKIVKGNPKLTTHKADA